MSRYDKRNIERDMQYMIEAAENDGYKHEGFKYFIGRGLLCELVINDTEPDEFYGFPLLVLEDDAADYVIALKSDDGFFTMIKYR